MRAHYLQEGDTQHSFGNKYIPMVDFRPWIWELWKCTEKLIVVCFPSISESTGKSDVFNSLWHITSFTELFWLLEVSGVLPRDNGRFSDFPFPMPLFFCRSEVNCVYRDWVYTTIHIRHLLRLLYRMFFLTIIFHLIRIQDIFRCVCYQSIWTLLSVRSSIFNIWITIKFYRIVNIKI